MIILAIETSGMGCSVALLQGSHIDSLSGVANNSHTEEILSLIDRLLKKHNLPLAKLDAIAFDAGPGSFTGLRIGAATAQGLALINNTPIIKVSSLQTIASQSKAKYKAVALDARMNQVYFASFIDQQIVGEEKVLAVDEIKLKRSVSWTLVGNGWQQYGVPNALKNCKKQFNLMPHAREVAILAQQNTQQDLSQAVPNYVRIV